MTEDANHELAQVKEEREKEKEEGRLEWMDQEFRDFEEMKMKMEHEKEESVSDCIKSIIGWFGLQYPHNTNGLPIDD